MVVEFTATYAISAFINISAISWWSVLWVEETGVPREKHRTVASHWQTLSHNVVSSTPRLSWIRICCCNCIAEILLKVVLNTINLTLLWWEDKHSFAFLFLNTNLDRELAQNFSLWIRRSIMDLTEKSKKCHYIGCGKSTLPCSILDG
jgi:hypothetical protein